MFHELLNKPVSRKEFLQHLAAGFLALIGVSGVLKALFDHGGKKSPTGYGSSGYGR